MSYVESQGPGGIGRDLSVMAQLQKLVSKFVRGARDVYKNVSQSQAIMTGALHCPGRFRNGLRVRFLCFAQSPVAVRTEKFNMLVEQTARNMVALEGTPLSLAAYADGVLRTDPFQVPLLTAFLVAVMFIHDRNPILPQ
jgi:hypothetical protein